MQVEQDRHYPATERRLRAGLFRQNLKEVLEHNSAPDNDWVQEMNMFADMTEEEKRGYTGFNASQVTEDIEAVEVNYPQYISNPSCELYLTQGILIIIQHYLGLGSRLSKSSPDVSVNLLSRYIILIILQPRTGEE